MKHQRRVLPIISAIILALILTGCSTSVSRQPETKMTLDSSATIAADCVVSYFRQGQAPYITSQKHRFNPTSGYLKVVANEPASSYEFAVKTEQFSQSAPLTEFLSGLPGGFVNQPLATALFYSFTAGAGLLPTETLPTGEPVKLEGQWYEPLQADWPQQGFQVILLRNTATNRIDSIGINYFKTNLSADTEPADIADTIAWRWLVKSYNLRYNNELKTLAPRTIDIYDVTDGIASKKQLVKFEYKTIQEIKSTPISE